MTAQDPDAIARAELRARQGLGARYDAPAAPAEMLLLARRGTAYFARKLNELDDHALDLPGYAGEPRRRIISRVGYQARALSRLIETARTGVTQPKHTSAEQIETELSDGATLPAHALRYLFAHSEVHLSVEWRDLSNAGWDVALTDWRGAPIGPRDTVLLRARMVWGAAVALGNGGYWGDVPPVLLTALLADAKSRAVYAAKAFEGQAQALSRADLAKLLLGYGSDDLLALPAYP